MNHYPTNRAAASPSSGRSPWPDRDEELRAHWAAGTSTPKIARAMNISKNAVVGRAHRLGLPSRPSPIKRREGPKVHTDSSRTIRKKSLPKLSELVNTEPTPPVASVPPATPKLHPPTHKSAAGLEAARQKAAEAAQVEVPKEDRPEPGRARGTAAVAFDEAMVVRDAVVLGKPVPLHFGSGCQFPMWRHHERPQSPPRFCGMPVIRTRDPYGNLIPGSYCERCNFITHSDSEAAKASLRAMYAERL